MGNETNNTNVNEGKAVAPQVCKISSAYYDPIDIDSKNLKQGDKITQETDVIRMSPQFTGYYGFGRSDGYIYKHTGYDYIAPVETDVIAVQSGYIEKIRFGPRTTPEFYYETKDHKHYYKKKFTCPFFDLFKEGTLNFNHNICKQCNDKFTYSKIRPPKGYKWKKYEIISEKVNIPQKNETSTSLLDEKELNKRIKWNRIASNCYGVQIWLRINYVSGYYAYYAHLSELNMDVFLPLVFSKLKETNLYNSETEKAEKTTIILDTPIQVNAGAIIGKSGCTGNARNMEQNHKEHGNQQHLHFECRTGDGEIGTQQSPNKIVKTEFVIKHKTDKNEPLIEEIKQVSFIDYLKEKEDINNEVEDRIDKAVSKKIQSVIDKEWNNTEKHLRKNRYFNDKWLEDISNKFTYDAWETFQHKWYPVKEKTKRSEVWKELYGEDSFNIDEHKRWIKNYQDCEKQWNGTKNKKGKDNKDGVKWKEYNDFKKSKFDKERRDNENTYKKEIKKESSESFKTKIINDKWESTYRYEVNALQSFKDNHILIVGKIKGCQDNTQTVS